MSRLRVTSNAFNPVTYTQRYTINGITPSWVAPLTLNNRSYHFMEDEVIKNFIARRAKGEVFCNSMLQYKVDCINVPTLIHSEGYCGSEFNVGHMHEVPPVGFLPPEERNALQIWLADEFASERNAAITAAWANVDESEINLMASFGEAPETVNWIKSIMGRLVSLIHIISRKQLAIQARKFFRSGDLIKAFADLWLEFRYAVRPLFFEMDAAVAAFNKILDKASRRTSRGGYGSKTPVRANAIQYFPANASNTWGLRWTVNTSTLHNYRAGVLYCLKDNVSPINEVWGINQPLEAIWELVPFSFILDWFFNIGNVISALNVSASLRSLASWVVEEHAYRYEFKDPVLVKNSILCAYNRILEIEQPGNSTGYWYIKRRIPSPTVSIMPSLRVNLDPAKILDLAFIGRSLFESMQHRR